MRRPVISSQSPVISKVIRTLPLLILLLALLLRVQDLDGSSFWSDEGLSLYRAQQSVNVILANTITIDGVDTTDTNPPLYFLLLHGWRRLTGESVWALRYLGVLLGVLNVAVMVPVARVLFGRWPLAVGRWQLAVSGEQLAVSSGQLSVSSFQFPVSQSLSLSISHSLIPLAAAFLLAISPFHIWYSQELRNYTLLLLCNLVATYGLWQCVVRVASPLKNTTHHAPRTTLFFFLWISTSLAGLAAHYFSFFVLAVQGLVLVVWLIWRWGKLPKWMWGAAAIFTLSLIPVLILGLTRWQNERQIDFVYVPIHHMLSHAFSAFATGVRPTFVAPLWQTGPLVGLVVVGVWCVVRVSWRTTTNHTSRITLSPPHLATLSFLLAWLFIPILILNLLSLVNPVYNGPRHLMMSLPPFLLLAAASLLTIDPSASSGQADLRLTIVPHVTRILVPILFLALIPIQTHQLSLQLNNEAWQRDEIRGVADYLTQVATGDDVIVVHDAIIQSLFDYYYEGAAAIVIIPPLYEQDVNRAITQLQDAAANHQRLWFLTDPTPRTGFPRTALSEWAEANWPHQFSQRFPSIHLPVSVSLYTPQPVVSTAPPATLAMTYGDELHLEGVVLPEVAQAGGYWQPTFYWSAAAHASQYILSFRFLDPQGVQWAQIDTPLWANYSPADWPAGAIIRYQTPLQLPNGMPPGPYQVILRLLRQSDEQPIAAANGKIDYTLPDQLVLSTQHSALSTQSSILSFNNGLDLFDYTLPNVEYRPGHVVPVTVYWQVRQTPTTDVQLRLRLLDGDRMIVSETVGTPTRADYPSTQWQPNELLMGQVALTVPALVERSPYTVQLSLLTAEGEPIKIRGREHEVIVLGEITTAPWPLVTELPAIATPFAAEFGQPMLAALHGYELSATKIRPGEVLELELVWRAAATLPTNYTIFVHLVDSQEQFAGQGDSAPLGGLRPTSGWRPGEVLVDPHLIPVQPDTPPGTYHLFIGFYDPTSTQRLPVLRDGIPLPDQRLWLGDVVVLP